MRIFIYKKVAAITLIAGFISGVFTSVFSGSEITDLYGSWIQSFYHCEDAELWLKAVFSCPFFVFAVFISGLFIFGYLCVYPVCFYYSYTFGFLITSAIICYGKESLIPILFKLPVIAATCFLLWAESTAAVRFSTEILFGSGFKTVRTQTSKYLGQGLLYMLSSAIILVYECLFIPKIFNL